ncbi:hypothetical protein RF11_08368 [Thelohanellus kitauei]|uniref:Tc1-like transposase DDE domain-containing protein n=1 Tax=Thelohanellus kitauei TaxID=669202 RepID=A0A0C2N7A4_THEKT|nr:hypothetical protein RF11_08368 [Thelohanellus kitauei]
MDETGFNISLRSVIWQICKKYTAHEGKIFNSTKEYPYVLEEIENSSTTFGHSYLYLPTYSRFINPIEEAFKKIKHRVRRLQPTSSEPLIAAIVSSYASVPILTVWDITSTQKLHR